MKCPSVSARQLGKKRGGYARINNNLRARLIYQVVQKGRDVKSVTERLNINLSTGKQIVQRYRRTGNYSDKRYKANTVLAHEEEDDNMGGDDYSDSGEDEEDQRAGFQYGQPSYPDMPAAVIPTAANIKIATIDSGPPGVMVKRQIRPPAVIPAQ